MGLVTAAFYDWAMHGVEAACLDAWRRDLVKAARGRVLEIGAGTGANVPHYPDGLEEIVVVEPDAHMRKRLSRRASEHRLTMADAAAEALPYDDASFDTVISTLVLCSVRDLDRTVAEVRRVLRPGGVWLFLEHGADEEGTRRLKWQRRLEPIWKRIAGGCHLTRRPAAALEHGGFRFERIERESMRRAPPFVRPTVRGIAVKV